MLLKLWNGYEVWVHAVGVSLMMHTKEVLNYASWYLNLCSVCLNSCCTVLKLISCLWHFHACFHLFNILIFWTYRYRSNLWLFKKNIVLIYGSSCRTSQESKVYLKQKLIRSARQLKNFWCDPLSWFCLLNFHATSSVWYSIFKFSSCLFVTEPGLHDRKWSPS